MPTVTDGTTRDARPTAGPVLVRVPAADAEWVHALPPVPDGGRLGVTVGDATLTAAAGPLADRGFDLLAAVPGRWPGRHVDLLVPATLRASHPRWFAALLLVAERVFDLRHGPVHLALRAELAAHLPAADHTADID